MCWGFIGENGDNFTCKLIKIRQIMPDVLNMMPG